MKYYLAELQEQEFAQNTAGVKARDDADQILGDNGYSRIEFLYKVASSGSISNIIKNHLNKAKTLKNALAGLKNGDELVVQFPIINNSVFHYKTFKDLKKRGVKVTLLIHDLETLRDARRADILFKTRIRLKAEEKSILSSAHKIIIHNDKMKQYILEMGIDKPEIVSLGIFDYLIPDYDEKKPAASDNLAFDGPVIIAGTLRPHKAGYAYKLPENTEFNLYGVGYEGEEDEHIRYFGAFPPDDLPFALIGSFGLVWDGPEAETCAGVHGQYLMINNPHKTSLYLASGIPVMIWSEAALGTFVTEHGCGITIDSIYDAKTALQGITPELYSEMKKNAEAVGKDLRAGRYLLKALEQ